jgi:membrane protease subunit (stomatin/prohibitin family)
MGFIKSIQTAASSQYNDQFREVIKCDLQDANTIIKKVTTENGVITNQSRLFVQPSQCAILVDNGAIKDILTEPGMYFMDTSAPTLFQTNIFKGIGQNFLEAMKRVAYQGQTITEQAVYFISLAEKISIKFQTMKPILYKDPEWGPIEISATGEFAFRIENPVNLLTNVSGAVSEFGVETLAEAVRPYILSGITSEIANLNLSFDEITTKQADLGTKVIKSVSSKLDSLGVEVTKLVVTSIDVPDSVKAAMRERTSIKMKATSVNEKEVDTYTKLNQAEALKDLANNSNNAGTTVMGMNVGNMFGGMITGNKDQDNK